LGVDRRRSFLVAGQESQANPSVSQSDGVSMLGIDREDRLAAGRDCWRPGGAVHLHDSQNFSASGAESAHYPYGIFCVSFGDAVTMPLWTRYRHLAPDHWKEVFPES
jgi:hypothetical protein